MGNFYEEERYKPLFISALEQEKEREEIKRQSINALLITLAPPIGLAKIVYDKLTGKGK